MEITVAPRRDLAQIHPTSPFPNGRLMTGRNFAASGMVISGGRPYGGSVGNAGAYGTGQARHAGGAATGAELLPRGAEVPE